MNKKGAGVLTPEHVNVLIADIDALGRRIEEQPSDVRWFKDVLVSLVAGLGRECENLSVGFRTSPHLLAWACRNLLEINVIAKYVLLSTANAKAFHDDWIIEDLEVFQSFRHWMAFRGMESAHLAKVDEAIQTYQDMKDREGLTRTKYLRTEEMAKAAHCDDEYLHVSKVTSKMIHPSAFSLTAPGKFAVLTPVLFKHGVECSVEAVTALKAHLAAHGAQPAK